MKDYHYSHNRQCKCGKLITNISKQCRKCANKQHSLRMKGYRNPNFGKIGYWFNKKRPELSKIKGRNRYNWNSILIKCPICNKKFWVCFCRIKQTKIICCSKKCSFKVITKFKTRNGLNNPAIKGNRNFKGKNNPQWIDGRSFEQYPIEFNEELKESIRKRDNYICQNCAMTEEEHLITIGKVLTIHHIDYNKKNCKDTNLISLCFWCNVRANYNRNYWQNFYQTKLGEKTVWTSMMKLKEQ